mmetsp:Transcript_5814/g.735  ORF Transcript_5814/g.735 Transcript_5814/m.735 type:complete len:93 (-) Transcript_5814:335-613(-)
MPGSFVNVKAKVPKGNGLWPAIWLLPPDARSKYGTWAACGEIDIMETLCSNNQGYGTLHYGGEWPHNVQGPPDNRYPVNPNWGEYNYFGANW